MKFLFLFLLSTAFWGVENTTPAIDAPPSNILEEHTATSEDSAEVFPGEAVMCCQASAGPLTYSSSSVGVVVEASGGEPNPNAPGVSPTATITITINGMPTYVNNISVNRDCVDGMGNDNFSFSQSLFGECPDMIRVDVRNFSVDDSGNLFQCSYDRFYLEERQIYNGSDNTTCSNGPGGPGGPTGPN